MDDSLSIKLYYGYPADNRRPITLYSTRNCIFVILIQGKLKQPDPVDIGLAKIKKFK